MQSLKRKLNSFDYIKIKDVSSVKASPDKTHREVTDGTKTFATSTTAKELIPIIDKEFLAHQQVKDRKSSLQKKKLAKVMNNWCIEKKI